MRLEELMRVLARRMRNARDDAGIEAPDVFAIVLDTVEAIFLTMMTTAILIRDWRIEDHLEQQEILRELRAKAFARPALTGGADRIDARTIVLAVIAAALGALPIGACAGWAFAGHQEPAKPNIVDLAEQTCSARLASEDAHCFVVVVPMRTPKKGGGHE